ncbi:MAG: TetR/AcrR family transcriptional regulator [Actinobacteria bacterium]|nr:TetR/AcrR family transcriptional regulator [Actinomycetota bacterium]
MKILRALVDLIVEEGPGTISIPQVAARADVSVRTVYHYFPTKEVLFDGLTASMSSMVEAPEEVQTIARSPGELAAAMSAVYRYLEANARMFRALSVSELGGRITSSRRAERFSRIDSALEPVRDRLDDDEYRRLRAVVGLIASFDGYDALTGVWGLTRDEAADAAAWALRTLTDRARRSGVPT